MTLLLSLDIDVLAKQEGDIDTHVDTLLCSNDYSGKLCAALVGNLLAKLLTCLVKTEQQLQRMLGLCSLRVLLCHLVFFTST